MNDRSTRNATPNRQPRRKPVRGGHVTCLCGAPRRSGGQDCRRCHAIAQRGYRARRGGHSGLSEAERKRKNAATYLRVYIDRGKVVVPSCPLCGRDEMKAVQSDPDRPLVVEWICRKCG